jgi:hypothetical protein
VEKRLWEFAVGFCCGGGFLDFQLTEDGRRGDAKIRRVWRCTSQGPATFARLPRTQAPILNALIRYPVFRQATAETELGNPLVISS